MKTMKIMRRLMGCAAAILALSACSESEDLLAAYHSDSKAVHITAQVGKASADGFTRSNPLGDADAQTKFNENDEISVQADGQDAVIYKLVGSEWQPKGNKFLKWEKETMNFTAYYPSTFKGTINQPTEYNKEADLAAADFMSFTGNVKNPGDNSLTLKMNRLMARVVVEIAAFNDQYTKNATVNSLSIRGVKAYKHETDGKFYALIDPKYTPSTAVPFLSLEVKDGESKTTETLTTIPTTFVAGNSYTYKLTVGKNKISVSGISVTPWNTKEITGGKAEHTIPYVTFKADTEQKFKMTTKDYTISGLEYSVNNSEWQDVVKDKEVTFGGANGTLRLRGTNTNGTASTWSEYSTITFTDKNVKVACTGNILTLLDWRIYNIVETNNAKFCYLFKDCAALTSAPELPATKLADDCYNSMFHGCTSLTAAPNLNATTLADGCYSGMFYDCASLTDAPELKATTLVNHCYTYMFGSCTNLTSAPELKATTLAEGCYDNMFYGCTKLSTVTMLAPSNQISEKDFCCFDWLDNAGTDKTVKSRTLKVMDADAYTALESNAYLPANWKKDATNTKVLNKDNDEIK